MNILFVTENEISPMQGGTERITHTLSREFMRLGHQCSLLYYIPVSKDFTETEFAAKMKLDLTAGIDAQIQQFLTVNKIDVAIVNLVRYTSKQQILPSLYRVSRSQGAKIIVCYHAMPGEDLVATNLTNIAYRLVHRYDTTQALKDLVNRLTPGFLKDMLFGKRLRAKYRLSVDNCDRFVLLSEHFYEPYRRIAGITDTSKFRAVPNALSFVESIHLDKLPEKQKRVLIVARMHERSKRISLALKIWKRIEKNPALNDWHLDIVGGGMDIHYFRQLIKWHGLKRCHLLGRQPELDSFYEESSIFMMTSAFEGFGITLIEAQQNGVVPIAFNSYASLRDIITSGENGVIVKNNDLDEYVAQLTALMTNDDARLKMAETGLINSQAFSQPRVTARWMAVISELII